MRAARLQTRLDAAGVAARPVCRARRSRAGVEALHARGMELAELVTRARVERPPLDDVSPLPDPRQEPLP